MKTFGTMLIVLGALLTLDPTAARQDVPEPPMAAAAQLGDADNALIGRLAPALIERFEKHQAAKDKASAQAIDKISVIDIVSEIHSPKKGFIFGGLAAGGMLASLLGFVLKAVEAAIVAALMGMAIKWALAHAGYAIGLGSIWVALTSVISWCVCWVQRKIC